MKNRILFSLLAMLVMLSACEKYLDEKSKKSLVVISTVKDLQALLDYNTAINEGEPSGAEISADNYYLTSADFNAMAQEGYRRMHTWEKDNFYSFTPNDWSNSYRVVYYANTVIEGALHIVISTNEQSALNNAIGQAYFHRARAFFNLAQIFTLAYDPVSSTKDLGIPLRMETDFNVASERSTNEETYQQVINDLKKSIRLLPNTQPSVLRPTKPAAYGLLSRVYLSMNRFNEAKLYADSCLSYNFKFLDFNTLNTTLTYPIARFNTEVINDNFVSPSAPVNVSISKVVPELYAQYHTNDLRKTVFFRSNAGGTYTFKGGYLGSGALFAGIAIDEVYLTRAECLIRMNDVSNGLKDLNALLVNRYKAGTYIPYANLSQTDALNLVLLERRKELLYRCLRWTDIKRLNKMGANIILKRELNNINYTLNPNSARYALPIPEVIVGMTGMVQNPR